MSTQARFCAHLEPNLVKIYRRQKNVSKKTNSDEKNSMFSTFLFLVFWFPHTKRQIIFLFCHHDSYYVLCYSLLMQEIVYFKQIPVKSRGYNCKRPWIVRYAKILSSLTPNFHVNRMHKMIQRHLWLTHCISLHVVANNVPRWHHESRPNVVVWGAMSRVRLF